MRFPDVSEGLFARPSSRKPSLARILEIVLKNSETKGPPALCRTVPPPCIQFQMGSDILMVRSPIGKELE